MYGIPTVGGIGPRCVIEKESAPGRKIMCVKVRI